MRCLTYDNTFNYIFMNQHYGILCKVHFEHLYFTSSHFTGYKLIPTDESRSLFLKYGLIIKYQPDGFIILFTNSFDGSLRDRESMLKEINTVQFSFHVTDPYFYIYTGNLPVNLGKIFFWLSNFDEKTQVVRESNLLHMSEFVSERDMKSSADASIFSGYIEIRFDVQLKEDLYIRFLNRSTYWRYILVSEHLREFEKPAIFDKANKKLFSPPEIIELPNGKTGIAFTSAEAIALTQQSDNHFRLVVNYDETTKQFERELISILPGPGLGAVIKLNDGNFMSEIYI